MRNLYENLNPAKGIFAIAVCARLAGCARYDAASLDTAMLQIFDDCLNALPGQLGGASGHLALGDVDSALSAIRAEIENPGRTVLDGLRVSKVYDEIRDDPRFSELLELLGSKETHTERYLKNKGV